MRNDRGTAAEKEHEEKRYEMECWIRKYEGGAPLYRLLAWRNLQEETNGGVVIKCMNREQFKCSATMPRLESFPMLLAMS